MSGPQTAFVLGGGGRWGAVEVGMLQALGEAGIEPELILGTSVGAFNGSVIADDPGSSGVTRLTDFWEEVSGADLFGGTLLGRMKSVATMRPALHETSEIRGILERVHGKDRLIEDLSVPFQCVAASIERSSEHWFTRGPLVDAVLASSAVPALFPPVEIGGEHFYDGGLVNSVPLTRAVDQGASVIFVLQVGRVETPLRPPEKLHEAALIAFEIARRHRFATTMGDLPGGVEVHLLPSGHTVPFDDRRQLRFSDTSSTMVLIEGAYRASRDYLSSAGLM